MNFLQVLLILKARCKIIVLTFFVTVITAIVTTLFIPKQYTSTSSLLLNYRGVDPVTGVLLSPQLMPGYMATQTDIIQSENIALKVIDQLGLAKSVQEKHQLPLANLFIDYESLQKKNIEDIKISLAELLLKKVNVTPSKESSLIELSFNSTDPHFSAAITSAFAQNYIETNIQLKVNPAQKANNYFSEQIKILRDNLEQAQSHLSKYQQSSGITNAEQALDVETIRLNELSAQLSNVQSSAIDSQSRKNSAQLNALDSPDVALNPVIQNLRVDISRAESKLAQTAQRLGRNHPEFQSSEAELYKLKNQLQQEIQHSANTISSTASINQQRESELRLQVNLQKKKVLELNLLRNEMAVLEKDVEVAKKAMDTVTQRFSETNIEGQSNQSEVAILNPATVPLLPSSPKMLINIILSMLMGGVLGVIFGFFAEIIDRRVRSREDIVSALGLTISSIIELESKK